MTDDQHLPSHLTPHTLDKGEAGGSGFIIVTGAAGFIGSCMIRFLNDNGYYNLVLVDDFGAEEKRNNWEDKRFEAIVERYNLFDWLFSNEPSINCIIHLGARTDTTEFDYAIHQELNVDYSKQVWNYCFEKQVPLIYASSAATYGSGELGYNDDHTIVEKLQPLNPYGISKNEFDKWALAQSSAPPFWAGLKFFNVYGPNEAHKKRMASVIFHSFDQVKTAGFVKLFKSHRPDFGDGQQLRDFVYVKDVVEVIYWMHELFTNKENAGNFASGLYNLGTGKARTFEDLVNATFAGMDRAPSIQFIDMPEDIRDKYQYFTEANMEKLRNAGYTKAFYSLEEGVVDYVKNYLLKDKHH